MRVIHYPYSKTKVFLCDRYHNKLASFELTQGENTLEINRNGGFYKTTSNRVFYVYEGAGILQWQDMLKHYNFKDIDISALDSYLCNGVLQSSSAPKINDFLEVYEKNLHNNTGGIYINPPHFENIEKSLLQGEL